MEIDYGNLMHTAMRGLIKTVLHNVEQDGLPGPHHFFITFDTTHPDVALADWLLERYPNEMTVVMQHWYENLSVGDDGFGITLNFGDSPEPLYIPYDSIKTFVDPSVEFGLRFESTENDDETDEPPIEIVQQTETDEEDLHPEPPAKTDAEVVSLDSFRK